MKSTPRPHQHISLLRGPHDRVALVDLGVPGLERDADVRDRHVVGARLRHRFVDARDERVALAVVHKRAY